MDKFYVIRKYFKGKPMGVVGDTCTDKQKADTICDALIKARPSDMLNYKVFEYGKT